MLDDQHASSTFPGGDRAEQAGRPAANHDDVKVFGGWGHARSGPVEAKPR